MVEALIRELQEDLGLSDWIINVKVSKKENEEAGEVCEAEIEDFLKYHEGNLTLYPSFFRNSKKNQEINLLHELTHLLLCRLHPHLAPSGDDALEEVVQSIAMQFYRLRHA